MIDLPTLARLAAVQQPHLEAAVAPLRLGGRVLDTDHRAAIVAAVNLSPDSTYRTSIAPDIDSAVRKAMVAAAEGADCIDLGAESSSERARRVDDDAQLRLLRPVVEQLHAAGLAVSVESYRPAVIERLLEAGAVAVNLTGSSDDQAVFSLSAQAGATLMLCYVPGATVRDEADLPAGAGAIEAVIHSLRPRLDRALEAGVTSIMVDPGIGFSYANLREPMARVAAQTRYLLLSSSLRQLGYPVLQSLPHAFPIFQEHYRSAEGYFAVLALLAGAGVLRVHETGPVRAVREAMSIDLAPDDGGGRWW